MKKNAFMEIKGLSIAELSAKSVSLQQEIAQLTLDLNMKKLKDLKSLGKKKRDLAQVKTVLRTKQLLELIETANSDEKKGAKLN